LIYNYGQIGQYGGLFVPKSSGMVKELPPATPIKMSDFGSRTGAAMLDQTASNAVIMSV
jgi:hypothetical protein